jgi:hypothetical protein
MLSANSHGLWTFVREPPTGFGLALDNLLAAEVFSRMDESLSPATATSGAA